MNASESFTTNKRPDLLLVIDDDDNLSNMLRIYFGARGYKVLTASSRDGKAGLEKALSLNPDLVVLDPLESGVEGFEVLGEIEREIRIQRIPLIILRLWNVRDNIMNDLETGQDDYMTKPFDVEELGLRIKSGIRRK